MKADESHHDADPDAEFIEIMDIPEANFLPRDPLLAVHDFQPYDTSQNLAENLAIKVAALLRVQMYKTGAASLAVSGGKTPVKFFEALSRQIIDWYRVTITLVDERFVETGSARSNAGLVRTHLLQNLASEATFVPMLADDTPRTTPEAALPAFYTALETVQSPFTVTVLGMGEDGHTASFFPGSRGLQDALNMANPAPAVAIYAAQIPEPRLTLTLAKLLASRQIFLHFEGAVKRKTFEDALIAGDIQALPIRAIIHQPESLTSKVPVSTLWCP